ncbi:hypothetical protein PTSG_12964 [Salpingoeca rosetta]|uniref:Crossover junction endonuclease MUS81 n=1 Tax=Salpingoeca rosetta (strain ATCC 50818 / BSB-021) TaxID=946362 RepID=F2UNL8_SALR5|nr:uncharacterized protein PTSG_12964 [Salpingoeca rosetta]EGD79223.1 hypothetical protein PTSG_12964 [Salpingoeca rosetta]|eukprot:XP_004989308.1 hypothetical protein PTSG_12964 [Salpingoeca rosetta]
MLIDDDYDDHHADDSDDSDHDNDGDDGDDDDQTEDGVMGRGKRDNNSKRSCLEDGKDDGGSRSGGIADSTNNDTLHDDNSCDWFTDDDGHGENSGVPRGADTNHDDMPNDTTADTTLPHTPLQLSLCDDGAGPMFSPFSPLDADNLSAFASHATPASSTKRYEQLSLSARIRRRAGICAEASPTLPQRSRTRSKYKSAAKTAAASTKTVALNRRRRIVSSSDEDDDHDRDDVHELESDHVHGNHDNPGGDDGTTDDDGVTRTPAPMEAIHSTSTPHATISRVVQLRNNTRLRTVTASSSSPTTTSVAAALGDVDSPTASGRTTASAFVLQPGAFDIVLLVDVMEHTGSRRDKGIIQKRLSDLGVACEVRKLSVGDFIWIARERTSPVLGQLHPPPRREIALDYVVERKRIDDLASSIMDGRFSEQKRRLAACTAKHPIYLIEHYGRGDSARLPAATLRQAVDNAYCQGFFVKETASLNATVAYLTLVTRFLEQSMQQRPAIARGRGARALLKNFPSAHVGDEFGEFNESNVKSPEMTASQMLMTQLMHISGLTQEKAVAIVSRYPTMAAITKAAHEQELQKTLAAMEFTTRQGTTRKIGPTLARVIARLYGAA